MLLAARIHSLTLPREQRYRSETLPDNGSFGRSVQLPTSPSPSPSLLHRHDEVQSSQVRFNPSHGHIQTLCDQGKLSSAVEALSLLHSPTSDAVYFALLRACNRHKDLHLLKQVHAHLLQHQVDLTGALGHFLAATLAMYGSIEEALHVFHCLAHCSVSSWNSIISACNQWRQSEKSLELYALMQEEEVEPDCHTFVSLIKACSNLRNLQEGIKLHAEARRKGVASDVYVSNSLVTMYGKCGSILEAEGVFSSMPEHNFASWTSMMLAYVNVDQAEKALRLYRQMLEENIMPNQHTFVIALQACYILCENSRTIGASFKMMAWEIGQALHADARRSGLVSNDFLCTTLVRMYGRLGRFKEAEHVFVSVSQHDSIFCNAMLSAYLEHDLGEFVLQLYRHMLSQGVIVDEKTFVLAIQACGVLAEKEVAIVTEGESTKAMTVELCQALHADARKKGFSSNVFLGTTLLGVYAKCGIIVEAEKVFGEFERPDLVSWTAMISAYVEQGQGELALQMFRQMQQEGFSANTQTFVAAIQACATLADKVEGTAGKELPLEIGVALHADARKKGLDSNVFVGTALVGMYGVCGDIARAENAFNTLSQRDLVAWNAMLNAYVDQGYGEKALQVYKKMLEEGIIPDQKTYVIVLQACNALEERQTAKALDSDMPLNVVLALHDDIHKRELASDVFIGNTLITMYGNLGNVAEAEDAFDALSHCPTVSWNAMLSTYVQLNQGEKALQLYRTMQDEGTAVNDVTLVCVLQASSQTGNLRLCKQIHFSIVSAGYELNPTLASTLIHAYGNCGSMPDAQAVFDALSYSDIVLWNVCIAGYAGEGNYESSMQMLEGMQLVGTKPDEVTLTSVLSACSHGGFVIQGLEYFESLCRAYNIVPDLRHFSSVTDLLGRAGDLMCLETIIEKLPMHASVSIWLSFLGACCVHGNAELGKEAFSNTLNFKIEEASAFIMMSNLYADFGLHELTEEDEDCEWWKCGVS